MYATFTGAQETVDDVDAWIENKPYKDVQSVDSLLEWSAQLEKAGLALSYDRGIYYADRFKGFYYDYKGDMVTSIDFYLKFLRGAKEANHLIDLTSAISDLVYMYITIGQEEKAKPLLLQVIKDGKLDKQNPKQLSVFYNNLGIVYKRSDQIDSAAWAYNRALEIKESIGDTRGLLDLKINLSSLHESLGNYDKTIQLSNENLEALGPDGYIQDIIYNLHNLGSGLTNTGKYSQAEAKFLLADSLSNSIDNIVIQEQTNERLSVYYNHTKQYEKAYERLIRRNQLKAEIVNQQSNAEIVKLREEYEAEKRELENNQLSSELLLRNNQIKFFAAGLLSLLIVTSVIAWFWTVNRRKNKLLEEQNNKINRQYEKLKQLNRDKNKLISLVSHDLSGPFSAIKVWAQGISKPGDKSSLEETKNALLRISDEALSSIDQALSIDKEELQSLEISTSNLWQLIADATTEGMVIAKDKNMKVNFYTEVPDLEITTDASMFKRIIKNLLSNAIKYSEPNTQIDIIVRKTDDLAIIEIKDQGIGISQEDQKNIFKMYDQGSASPTAGEESYGLGLSIVKRLVDELGGIISVKSLLGKGSTFTLMLPI